MATACLELLPEEMVPGDAAPAVATSPNASRSIATMTHPRQLAEEFFIVSNVSGKIFFPLIIN
jgi:hypothetical protein